MPAGINEEMNSVAVSSSSASLAEPNQNVVLFESRMNLFAVPSPSAAQLNQVLKSMLLNEVMNSVGCQTQKASLIE